VGTVSDVRSRCFRGRVGVESCSGGRFGETKGSAKVAQEEGSSTKGSFTSGHAAPAA